MQKITKIYDLFAEEAFNNMFECEVIGDAKDKIIEATPIYLQQWDKHRPLFSFIKIDEQGIQKEHQITLSFDHDVIIPIEPVEPPKFNHLFWLEPKEDTNRFTFKFVECGLVTPLQELDIAINDSTLISLAEGNTEKLINKLSNTYIFDAGKYQLLFARSWQNGSQEWHLYGMHTGKEKDSPRYIEVPLDENEKGQKIRLVKKEIKGKRVIFPTEFDKLDVFAYQTVRFVDFSKARETQEAIRQRRQSGTALISLWQTYSDMELQLAKEEIEELGFIKYTFERYIKGVARLRLNVSHDQSIKLVNLASSRAQFELINNRGNQQNTIVTLVKYNQYNYTADFEFEFRDFKENGEIKLSSIGDEVVNNRRQFAIKILSNPSKIVLQNLLFAIENESSGMLESPHKPIQALTNKTRTFLRDKFGIENLTANQEEAVRIALNNINDITIIQGPPGTGKTTVVAAICHRLLELANSKKSKESLSKIILASAFQNDTIEHLASKIYTHGLPTVKIGRKTMGIRAEEQFIHELELYLQSEIDKLGGNEAKRISHQLSEAAVIFEKEKRVEDTISEIENILQFAPTIEGIDIMQLHEIMRAMKKYNRQIEAKETLIASIPTSESSYNFENGFEVIAEVLESGLDVSEKDRLLLEQAPEINPEAGFIENLVSVKENLLMKLNNSKEIATSNLHNEISSWIASAIQCAVLFEESNYENEEDFLRSILTELKNDLKGNTPYIRRSLQEYGETIAATNQLAGSREMSNFSHIKNVILEEAARSNPLDLLIPIIKAEERIIMVGDQNQLPHLLETEVAEKSLESIENIDERKDKRLLYERSLFGIIFDNVKKGKRKRHITLEEQFRMHPSIGDFISNTYYDGILKAGSKNLSASKRHNLTLPWAKEKTMVFCNVDGSHQEGKGQSKYRTAEAVRIMSLIDELKTDPEFANLSIGVITFYSRQVNVLFEEAAKQEHGYAVRNSDGYDIHPSYQTFADDKEKMRIGSVDSFQGKEFDVVILSTVRSNSYAREDGNEKKVFGFLTLANRLNVAFSRAKKLVIVVGDAEMFEDDFAKKYVPGLYEFCSNITKNKEYGNRI